jgi:hypothetical protein
VTLIRKEREFGAEPLKSTPNWDEWDRMG